MAYSRILIKNSVFQLLFFCWSKNLKQSFGNVGYFCLMDSDFILFIVILENLTIVCTEIRYIVQVLFSVVEIHKMAPRGTFCVWQEERFFSF